MENEKKTYEEKIFYLQKWLKWFLKCIFRSHLWRENFLFLHRASFFVLYFPFQVLCTYEKLITFETLLDIFLIQPPFLELWMDQHKFKYM